MDILRVELAVGVTGFELKVEEAPPGSPETLNVTCEVQPPVDVTVTMNEVDCP